MSLRALVVKPLFNDFISGGLGSASTELRISLVERWNNNTAWASETSIEYAIWAQNSLGNIGDAPIQGNAESTDGSGEIVIDTTGFFNSGDTVLVAIRKTGAGPGSATVYGLGEELKTSS